MIPGNEKQKKKIFLFQKEIKAVLRRVCVSRNRNMKKKLSHTLSQCRYVMVWTVSIFSQVQESHE